MSPRNAADCTVLVADDEPDLADLYTEYLAGQVDEVLTAYGGREARALLDVEDVDIALLDRRMPDLSGDEVLASITERGIDCQVAMVTAVDPDFDLVDMGCDAYLVKPVSAPDLRDLVDRLARLSAYSETQRELTAKKLTRNLLTVEKSRQQLEASEEFTRLEREITWLEAELEGLGAELPSEDRRRQL